jgi:hypothetical protein
MSLVLPPESSGNFELCPSDTHIATCYRIIDLGTQRVEFTKGEPKFPHQCMLSWELAAKMSDGRPFSIHKRYTYSSHEKSALRIDLESWRGKAFTPDDYSKFKFSNLLAKSCLMGIIHETGKNGKVYANISSIMKLPTGMTAPPLVNDVVDFDLGEFDAFVYESLSQNLRDTIAQSPEYAQAVGKRKEETQDTVPDEGSYGAKQPLIDDSEIPF